MNDTQKPAKRHIGPSRWVLGCALPVVLFVGLVGVRALVGPWPHPPLWQVERVAEVKFPKSARLLNSYGRWFMEVHVYAKVEIDAADVEPFIKSLPKSLTPYYQDNPRSPVSQLYRDWWDCSKARKYRILNYLKEPTDESRTEVHWFFIDLDNPQKAVVYLWYGWF
jgi:hypothetical protein